MAHKEQVEYCEKIKALYPEQFKNKFVLDLGSLDINGNNQYLFENCLYLGVDIGEGKNVDIISKGHELKLPDSTFDVIISTECLEHDMYYEKTLRNLYRMLKPGGFLIFTCATTGRPEHGTRRTTPGDAFLLPDINSWSDYYKNLTENDFKQIFDFNNEFSNYAFDVNLNSFDIYFYGFKAGELITRRNYSVMIENSQNQLVFEQYKNELVSTQNELELKQNELNIVYNSRSWKLTKPLRIVMRVIKEFCIRW